MSAPLVAFLLSVLSGAVSVALWSVLDVLRQGVGDNRFINFILDLIWWAISAGLFCVCIWHANSMELRFFELTGVGIGAVLYYLTLYRPIRWVFAVFLGAIVKIIKFIFKILLTPWAFLYKILVVGIMKNLCFKKGKVANNDSPQELNC